MDFELGEEQRLLRESVTRLLADRYRFEDRRRYGAEPGGWSRAMWSAYAEMGLLGLPFDEAEGGVGGGPVETMVVMEALGAVLSLEPYLPTVVLGGGLLRRGAPPGLRAALLPRVAEGALLLALAHTEPEGGHDLAEVGTRARREGSGWVLEGRKSVVLAGDVADKLLVTARVSGGTREERGVGVFLVDGGAPGLSRRGYPVLGGGRGAEVSLAAVPAEAVLSEGGAGDPEDGTPLLRRVSEEGMAAVAAEALGVMTTAHALTLEHLRTRRQFGVPLGSFQVLRHRAADMLVALEGARSMVLLGAMMAGEEEAGERARAMAAVKVQVGRSGRRIGQEAVQLHGALGVTMEYAVGHCLARLAALDAVLGDAEHHLRRLSAAGGLVPAGE